VGWRTVIHPCVVGEEKRSGEVYWMSVKSATKEHGIGREKTPAIKCRGWSCWQKRKEEEKKRKQRDRKKNMGNDSVDRAMSFNQEKRGGRVRLLREIMERLSRLGKHETGAQRDLHRSF